ncbi:unnamed protein product [Owenia fusiformis]|uniref:Cationic amino acid transporter C-terminal domain-containing protein n=1 Tax=Owenia fusiformis TaxID=6347 RepID=A0A8S4N2M3_OWEFU|nr:unnamed protein product [Owenia fusiformis]
MATTTGNGSDELTNPDFSFDTSKFKRRMFRTKSIKNPSIDDGEKGLKKCLTTLDLTSLGVGSCCGTGMYVVAGLVAEKVAGPGVILSFIIAAIASMLSGVCYAEFGVRVPKTTGSAYMYSYVTVGEFVAFLIGWNMILEYLIGTAAGASALSWCFDSLGNHTMSEYLITHVGTVIGKAYPDFLGCGIAIIVTIILAVGVKKSLAFNHALNAINLIVWVFIMIAGFCYANGENWSERGFFPYGLSGVFSGAATCFYAFIGFDIIATTGEEAKTPTKSIPIAIMASLIICLVAYVSVSTIVTLVVPYYEINGHSALEDMFAMRGMVWGRYVVAVGAVAGLTVSLLGSMFPMPRVIYAMSRDGLLFKFLSKVHSKTETPMLATFISGIAAALLALLVGLQALVEMMSIGTLLSYTLVSISVLILRYEPEHKHAITALEEIKEESEQDSTTMSQSTSTSNAFTDDTPSKNTYKDGAFLIPPSSKENKSYGTLMDNFTDISGLNWFKRNLKMWSLRLGFPGEDRHPTHYTARIVTITIIILAILKTSLSLLIVFGVSHIQAGEPWAIIVLLVLICAVLIGLVVILMQPQNKRRLKFMAPCVPVLPMCAMMINIYLMLKLSSMTWIRFAVWLVLGIIIYFAYGIRHSVKEAPDTDPNLSEQFSPYNKDIKADTTPMEETKINELNGNLPHSKSNGATPHSEQSYQNGAPPINKAPPLGQQQNQPDEKHDYFKYGFIASPKTEKSQSDEHHDFMKLGFIKSDK